VVGLYEKILELVVTRASAKAVEAALLVKPNYKTDPERNSAYASALADGYSIAFEHARMLPKRLKRSGFVAVAAHLYPAGRDGFASFPDLPHGLEFGMSQARACACLGEPISTGGGGFSGMMKRKLPKWTKHEVDGGVLHVEYEKLSVSLVTLMPADDWLARL
jgi:hypothetical protein